MGMVYVIQYYVLKGNRGSFPPELSFSVDYYKARLWNLLRYYLYLFKNVDFKF